MKTEPLANKLLFCVEDRFFRDYLESHFQTKDDSFVDYDQFVYRVAEDPRGVLVLQSETHEYDVIEMCKKLKRLFGSTIKIVLLSADYQVQEYSKTVVDAFLQFPVSKEELVMALGQLVETRRKILLIDDSKLVHKHLCPPLAEEGYETFSAMDGQEGLEMAQKILPDLIISDIEMPRMNGFEACSAIRKIPALAEIPIIMSSTLGSVSDQRKGFAAGVDEYITKPVHIPELLVRLERIFQHSLVGRESILVVEPDLNIARNMSKTLAKQGFSPRVCTSIQDAIKVLRRFTHELVISEADLGDGSAIDLIKAMRMLPKAQNSDLLVLTDQDNQAEVKMVMQAGAKGVVLKPFNQDNLLANVERTIANQRAEIEKAHIEKYVSKASRKMAVEKSILSGADNTSRAYRKNATIFFSDIKNFTNRCERYAPREVVDQINTLFSVITRAITSAGGDIDKFIGDACMAFWMDEDPARSAAAALGYMSRIREEIATMNASHPLLKDDPIFIRMGLNTGEVILCDIGAAEARIDLTLIGDAVNLAARLESGAKQYGLDNLVSEFTLAGLHETFAVRPIDLIRVKGKDKPVAVFELFGTLAQLDERQAALRTAFVPATLAYREGKFAKARELFEPCLALEAHPEGINPTALMLGRCDELLKRPPPNWDGVWTLTDK
ncbi:MAG: response regulator [Spirochaetales bacterium]